MRIPETAVIILNYNGEHCLPACLRSLLQSSYEDFEIILVDNNSSDGSLGDAEQRFKDEVVAGKLRVVARYENNGFAAGNNIGYRRVRRGTRFVCLLNYDSLVPRGWLGLMVKTMREHPELAVLGGSIRPVGVPLGRQEYVALTLCQEYGSTGSYPETTGVLPVFVASGNGMLLRRDQFTTLFHPLYFAYAEDIDLCWNARLRGIGVGWQRRAVLQHVGSAVKQHDPTLAKLLSFHGAKNQVVNFLVHYERRNLWRILPLFLLTQVGQVLHDPRKVTVKVRAYLWVCKERQVIMAYRRKIQRRRKVADNDLIPELSGTIHQEQDIPEGFRRSLLHRMNALALLYCHVAGLRTIEVSK